MNKSVIWLGIGLLFFGAFVIFLVNELREPLPMIVEPVPYDIESLEREIMELDEFIIYEIGRYQPDEDYEIWDGGALDTVYIDVYKIDTVYVHKIDTVYVNKIDLDRIFDGLDRLFGSIEMLLSLIASGLAFYKFWDSRKTKE